MKVHDSKAAPNPRRVRIFVAEKGLDVPFEEVDIMNAVNRQAEFRQKNPMGTVPVLELDDGTCIAESAAICRYFEEIQPEPPLLGVDATDRAVVAMWDRRMEFELLLPIADSFRQHHAFFKGRIEQCPEYAEVAKRRAVQNLAWLDEVLADRQFVAGERFSVADITALCAVDFGRVSKIGVAPEQKNPGRAGMKPCRRGPAPRRSLFRGEKFSPLLWSQVTDESDGSADDRSNEGKGKHRHHPVGSGYLSPQLGDIGLGSNMV